MEYYVVGQLVRLTHLVLNDTGVPTNATTVTLVITLPDTTIVTITTPTNVSTGNYRYDYTTTQAGRHTYRWDTTNPVAPDDGTFDVHGPLRSIVGIEWMKEQLGIAGTGTDERLRGYMESATDVVERHTGKTVVRTTITEDHTINGYTPRIILRKPPVITVVSIGTVDGSTTWSPTDLYISADTGIITHKRGGYFHGHIETVYVAGMTVIPSSYGNAQEVIVQHLWQTRRGTRGVPRPGVMDDTVAVPGFGFAVPRAALELLGPSPWQGR